MKNRMVQGLQTFAAADAIVGARAQLQQSLALLQAPTLELKALVEHELEQNPVLEEVAEADLEQPRKISGDEGELPASSDSASDGVEDTAFDTAEKNSTEPVDDFQAEFDKLVQLDQEWRDHFSQTNIPIRQSAEDEESGNSCSTRSRSKRRSRNF